MTTTRLQKNLLLEQQYDEPVTPSKSLCLIKSFPCEEKNAHIRRKTRDAINSKNAPEVAFRYLQNKQGQKSTSIEATLAAMFLVLTIGNLLQDIQSNEVDMPRCFGKFIILLYCVFTIIPNINNMMNYNATKKKSERWLENNLEKNNFDKIIKITYNSENIKSLNQFFIEKGYGSLPEKVLNKKNNFKFPSSTYPMLIGTVFPEILGMYALLMTFQTLFQPGCSKRAILEDGNQSDSESDNSLSAVRLH